jgi:tripartite-type tricarboxylate transporter receptor subunit TctC
MPVSPQTPERYMLFSQPAVLIASFFAIATWASAAIAQSYPSKPIRLVLRVGTGGVGATCGNRAPIALLSLPT